MKVSLKRKFQFLFASAVLSSLISNAALCQTKPDTQTPRLDRSEARAMINQLLREGKIMRADQVKRGMRGIGRSVFQGGKIEEFKIEVIGNLKKVMGGGDLVLIKVLDGPVVKRNSGIIAGMSGSPVYINGKMLGAIAIGFGFPKEPIGGVTPITQMIEGALPDNAETKRTVKAAKPALTLLQPETYRAKKPLAIGGQRFSQVIVSREFRSSIKHSNAVAMPGALMGRPCNMLMQLSGFSPASLPRLKQMFEPWGIEPVIGTGGAMRGPMSQVQAFSSANEKTDVNPPFVPGGAIGVPLVTGDLDMSGVGTITFRWGKRILAFGHPMFGKGAVSMPMTSAYIHDIFPSYQQSFKLASPVREVGVLQQDTEFAIGGTIGRRADMVPMHVRLKNAERGIDRTYNVRLIKDPLFTPMLLQMVGAETLAGAFGMDSDKMVRVKFKMQLEGLPPVEKQDFLYAQSDVMMPALGDLFESIMLTQMNPYSRGDIKQVDLEVSLEPKRRTAVIKRISADRNRAKAGETVRVNVLLEPHETPDQYITRTFNFKVPDDAPGGTLRVSATPGADFWQGQSRVGGAPPNPQNLKELVQAYTQAGASDELMVQASTPQAFLMIGRQKVSNPPSSWAQLVPPRASSSIGAYNETQVQRDKMNYSLSGAQYIAIPVESARHSDRERPDTGTTGDSKTDSSASSLAAAMAAEEASTDVGFDPSEYEDYALNRLPFTRQMQSSPMVGPHMKQWWNRVLRSHELGWRSLQVGAETPAAEAAVAPSITPSITPSKTTTTTAKVDEETADETATAEEDGNLARPVSRWIQDDVKDFSRGTYEGTAASSDGTIRPAARAEMLATTTQPAGWSVASDRNGNTYMGAGHKAQIYRFDAKGNSTLLYDGPEVAITALATDDNGNLYAGIAPGAKVLRFNRDGLMTSIFDGPETFVWALEHDAQGRLLIATGGGEKSGGAIYRLGDAATRTNSQGSTPFVRVPQRHVRSLAVRGTDIFAGTGDDDAVLYQVSSDTGALKALYEAGVGAAPSTGAGAYDPGMAAMMGNAQRMMMGGGMGMQMMGADAMMLMAGAAGAGMASGSGLQGQGTEITAIAALPDGVYFGTASSGTIYRWTAERGAVAVYAAPARAVYALRAQNGKLFAGVAGGSGAAARAAQMSAGQSGTGAVQPISLPSSNGARGAVYQIEPMPIGGNNSGTRAVRLIETTQPQVLAIALSPSGDLVAATGNNAAVYRVPLGAQNGGTYISNVLDAGRMVNWGALRVISQNAPLETRSGNTVEPDATWSDWQGAAKNDSGEWRVTSPSARYLQYRAKLGQDGSLSRVEVIYRPQNQAPTVQFASPAGGEFLKAKDKLSWKGKDPDGDTLRYRLWLSREGGDWQPVELKKTSAANHSLEKEKWPDGTYRAKVETTDRERNPEDPRRDETISQPFTIDNTAPKLDGQTIRKQDGAWRVRAVASDQLSPLVGAEWRVFVPKAEKSDNEDEDAEVDSEAETKTEAKSESKTETKASEKTEGKAEAKTDPAKAEATEESEETTESEETEEAEWHAMAAADGIFDARREEIVASIEALAAQGKMAAIQAGTIIEIRTRDAASNSTTIQVTLS